MRWAIQASYAALAESFWELGSFRDEFDPNGPGVHRRHPCVDYHKSLTLKLTVMQNSSKMKSTTIFDHKKQSFRLPAESQVSMMHLSWSDSIRLQSRQEEKDIVNLSRS
jgi:hypothetical protein